MRQTTASDRLLRKAERARKKAEACARARAATGDGAVTSAGTDEGDMQQETMDRAKHRSASPPVTPSAVVGSAYLGMQPTVNQLRGSGMCTAGAANGQGVDLGTASRGVGGQGHLAMSLDEQEALILRMLEK